MRANAKVTLLVLAMGAVVACASAQVITTFEIKDPNAQRLQQRYLQQLNEIGAQVQAHHFPYPFYFSRKLDIDEAQQQRLDQRSIRFDKYNGQTVLEITGNYYAAYSADLLDKGARLRKTYEDVVLPILKITIPKFPPDDSFAGFAIEVSHHLRRRVMGGVMSEKAENVVFILPRAAAHHLMTATNLDQQQAALLDSEIFVDAEPVDLWLTENHPPATARKNKGSKQGTIVASLGSPPVSDAHPESGPAPTVSSALIKGTELPVRLVTPDTLTKLKAAHQDVIARMLIDLGDQAHFTPYAPPTFIAFHQGAYLQLSLATPLAVATGSRYRLAALAFDDHISHLVRPVLAYFQQDADFDGIGFSTTVKTGPDKAEGVEFFLPFSALRCYANYDCTGQQLLDAGIVLINGERAGLRLDVAEK